MPRRPLSGAAARAAWLVIAASGALVAGACRELVTDDVVDAEQRLCARLDACDIPGCDRVEAFFTSGTEAGIDVLLTRFGDFACDAGCADAPICLDVAGVCLEPGAACPADALCCGASGGESRCGTVVADGELVDGTCCLGLGVPCGTSAECCALDDGRPMACEVPEGGAAPTCGGAPACGLLGTTCSDDAACCSGTCVGGVCDRVRCVPSGGACVAGDTCCSASETCGDDGVCATPPVCVGEERDPALCGCGEVRETCTPGVAGSCCDDLICVPTIDGDAVCASESCLPIGTDCAADEPCRCGGDRPNAVCLEVASTGVGAQRTCQVLACTVGEGGPCGDGQPCCASSGLVCDALPGETGACVPDCEPSSCFRDPLLFGPPITPLDRLDPIGQGDPECVANATCADAVCEEDAYCCCQLWDELCVAKAQEIAGRGDGVCGRSP